MRSSVFFSLVPGAALFQAAHGLFPSPPRPPRFTLNSQQLAEIDDPVNALVGKGTFEQPIDHNDPSCGTFNQSYWYNATFWEGPGSPVVFFTPGESAAEGYTGYLSDLTLTGVYAEAIGGAVIVVEHRFWGNSSPVANQTTEALQYLTVEQAVADFVSIARNIKLPFDQNCTINAPTAPWIYVGGSYSGALASWIEKLSPGTFWAYHGSSAPVQAIYDFWQYFYPIQQGMPQNCSKDYEAIIDHVDTVFESGTDSEKLALKKMFLVDALTHDDDAASAISSPIWVWQDIEFYSDYSAFYQMCDAIEGAAANSTVGNSTYSADGVGLAEALPNFAQWFRESYIVDYCNSFGYSDWAGDYNVQCFNTYNASMEVWNDWTPTNAYDRPWVWLTCNQPFFYYQTGAPEGIPTVFTRLATASYYERQCSLFFPPENGYTYASARGKSAADFNAETDGWYNVEVPRLLYSNGEFDPWRSASVSSVFRPGGMFNGTEETPVILMEGAIHCNDLLIENGLHESVRIAQRKEIVQIREWVGEFYGKKKARGARGSGRRRTIS